VSSFQRSLKQRVVETRTVPSLLYTIKVCSSATPDTFSCLRTFKNYLYEHYSNLIFSVFDVNLLCTWSMSRNCPCHRIWLSYVFCIVIYCFVFLFCYTCKNYWHCHVYSERCLVWVVFFFINLSLVAPLPFGMNFLFFLF
jgi:hypothetical protein